jgi:tetratricopeptide (TPR) repeat protein
MALRSSIEHMRASFWIAALVLIGLPWSAQAEGTGQSLIERGVQLRREHRDAEALDLFRQAYRIAPSPRTRAQIALAEQALGQWADAEKDLNEALGVSDDEWIRGYVELLKDTLSAIRQHLATLAVESNLPGAEVWINGALASQLPLLKPLRIAAGDLEYEVRLAHHASVRRRVTVAPESTVHDMVEFDESSVEESSVDDISASATPTGHAAADRDARPREQSLATASTAVNQPPLASGATLASAPPPPDHSATRSIAWGTLGGAGALLAAAVVAQVIHEESAARYNDDALCLKPGLSRDETCGIYRGRADTAGAVAIASYVGAGALAIAAGAFFLASSPRAVAGAGRFLIGASTGGFYSQYSVTF